MPDEAPGLVDHLDLEPAPEPSRWTRFWDRNYRWVIATIAAIAVLGILVGAVGSLLALRTTNNNAGLIHDNHALEEQVNASSNSHHDTTQHELAIINALIRLNAGQGRVIKSDLLALCTAVHVTCSAVP